MIENYEDYKKIMGLESVDVGSKLQLLKHIKKMQKEKGKTTKGFSGMPIRQLKAIYNKLNTLVN